MSSITYTGNKNGRIVVTQHNWSTTVSFFKENGDQHLSDINIINHRTEGNLFFCTEGGTGKEYFMQFNNKVRPIISL